MEAMKKAVISIELMNKSVMVEKTENSNKPSETVTSDTLTNAKLQPATTGPVMN